MRRDVVGGHRFTDHGGHPRLAEHRVRAAGGAGVAAEERGQLTTDGIGNGVPRLRTEAAGFVVAAAAPGGVAGAECEEEVGGVAVGLCGQHGIARTGGVERSAGAELQQPAHDQVGQGLEAGRGGHEHAPSLEPVRSAPQRLALAHARHRSRGEAPDPFEHRQCGGTTHAVGREVHVALELDQRARGVVAQDAVLAAGVEAESVESALELGDVVTPQHRPAPIEEPVAQAVPALDDRRPRLRPADAVDPQAARVLEGADHRFRGRAVPTDLDRGDLVTQSGEADLEVAYRLAATARPEHGRVDQAMNSARSWSSWPLPLAPTRRLTCCPSLNTSSVGMLITSNRRAVSGLSSTLSLPIGELALLLAGDLGQRGGDHLAGTTPLGPEVDEHGGVGTGDGLVERRIGEGEDVVGHWVVLS